MARDATHRFLKDILDHAVETGAPLIVRRRCNPHQLAVWLSIRFLLDTTDRTAFGSREIGEQANLTSFPRVLGWISDLVQLELLEIVGYEEIKGAKNDRPIYRIPWKRIIDASSNEAERYLTGLANPREHSSAAPPHESQLAMDMAVTDRSQELLPIGNRSRDPLVTAAVIDR